MPVSSNSQYKSFMSSNGKIRHAASEGLRKFKSDMNAYWWRHQTELSQYREIFKNWVANRLYLDVHCLFLFEESKVFTKDGRPKKMDTSNRLKAIHDCLADYLQIDDCYFFRISAEKWFANDRHTATVDVHIKPYSMCRS
jgi:Holliday junction resolvase RusA-like endonuclease